MDREKSMNRLINRIKKRIDRQLVIGNKTIILRQKYRSELY
jgi:hypothetical protein